MKKLIMILAGLFATPAFAQDLNFATVDEGTHVVTLTTGAEHGLVLGLGYAYGLEVKDQPIILGADLALQWAEVDASDFKLRAGALVPVIGYGKWKLIAGATATVRGTDNAVARMINVGADGQVLAGRYSKRWFAAAEVGFDWAFATHIENSDTYKMQVYADAKDGWYGNTGGTLRTGIQGGVSFGGNDVILRAGMLQGALLPFYATIGYDRRF